MSEYPKKRRIFERVCGKAIDATARVLTPNTFYVPPKVMRTLEQYDKEDRPMVALLCQALVGRTIDAGAAEFTADINDMYVAGEHKGDWRVTIEQLGVEKEDESMP